MNVILSKLTKSASSVYFLIYFDPFQICIDIHGNEMQLFGTKSYCSQRFRIGLNNVNIALADFIYEVFKIILETVLFQILSSAALFYKQ